MFHKAVHYIFPALAVTGTKKVMTLPENGGHTAIVNIDQLVYSYSPSSFMKLFCLDKMIYIHQSCMLQWVLSVLWLHRIIMWKFLKWVCVWQLCLSSQRVSLVLTSRFPGARRRKLSEIFNILHCILKQQQQSYYYTHTVVWEQVTFSA